MAEDKTSILIYTDLLHTVCKMPDDKAGLLFKKILEYANDLNPPDNDLLVDLVFEPIKQRMKRDLVKWLDSKEVKSNSGILGNIKRWHPDLYGQITAGKITIETALKIAENRKTSQPDELRSQDVANIAVSVSVSDSVNVSGNVSENSKSINKGDKEKKSALKKASPPPKDIFIEKAKLSFEKHPNDFGGPFKKLWLQLIQMKKWRRKSQSALDMSLGLIVEYDEPFATALVKKAIAGDYQGIAWDDTPDKYENYLKKKDGKSKPTTANEKQQSVSDLMDIARQVLAGNAPEETN